MVAPGRNYHHGTRQISRKRQKRQKPLPKTNIRIHASMEVSPPSIRPSDSPNPIILTPTNPDCETLNPPPGRKARKKQANRNHRVTSSSHPSHSKREKKKAKQYVAERSTPTKIRDGPWGCARNQSKLLENTCRALKFSAYIYRREVDVALGEVAHARAKICHLNAELVEKDVPDDRNQVFEYLEHPSTCPGMHWPKMRTIMLDKFFGDWA